jgi:hypothetical protein
MGRANGQQDIKANRFLSRGQISCGRCVESCDFLSACYFGGNCNTRIARVDDNVQPERETFGSAIIAHHFQVERLLLLAHVSQDNRRVRSTRRVIRLRWMCQRK